MPKKQAQRSVKKTQRPSKTEFELAVAERVKKIRIAKGISQGLLAELIGVTRGFIGQVESANAPSTYSLNHLNRLAKQWNCSPREFLPEKSLYEAAWKED